MHTVQFYMQNTFDNLLRKAEAILFVAEMQNIFTLEV